MTKQQYARLVKAQSQLIECVSAIALVATELPNGTVPAKNKSKAKSLYAISDPLTPYIGELTSQLELVDYKSLPE